MPTSYTSLLGLALPVQGELAGTWGDTVNDYITQYLDAAVAGTQTISGSQTAVTLSKTTAVALSQAGAGATGSSQYQIINCTGNPGGLLTITVPAASRAYLILNNTSTNQSVKIVGTGPTTGVTVAAAQSALVAWNGSDFELVASTDASRLTGVLATANGGTGLSTFAANQVFYASSSSAVGQSPNLTFSGTTLLVNTATNTNSTNLTVGGEISETVSGTQVKVVSQPDIGSAPNEIPLNQYLGNLAYQNANAIAGNVGVGGYLGVGTTEPAEKLHIVGTGLPTAKIESTNASGSPTLLFYRSVTGVQSAQFVGNITFRRVMSDSSEANAGAIYWAGSNEIGSTLGSLILQSEKTIGFRGGNAASDQMTLDASGNLGLGVTPSAWGGSYAGALQVKTASLYSASDLRADVASNVFYNGTAFTYVNTGFATTFSQVSGQHRWFTAPSGTAGNAISFTQAMTLDANGYLGIGTTSPGSRIQVSGDSIARARTVVESTSSSSSILPQIVLNRTSNSSMPAQLVGGITFSRTLTDSTADNAASFNVIGSNVAGSKFSDLRVFSTDVISFYTTSTSNERARFTGAGNFSIGGSADRGTTVGSAAIQLFDGTAPAGTLTNGVSLYSASGDLNFMDSGGSGFKIGYRNIPPAGTKTTSYTLATSDVGKYIQLSTGGSITIPTGTFAEGDVITLFNNTTGNITITCSALTTYVAGINTARTSLTLSTRGIATVMFISGTVCVVSGNVA